MALYNWPVKSFTISQNFGGNASYYAQYGQKGHNGMDLAVPNGTPVYASRAGVVNFEGWGQNNSWMGAVAGIAAIIDHGDVYTGYAHMTSTVISRGQSVAQGQLIGYSGSTGGVTGPHLHFEFIGKPINFNNGFAGRVNPAPYNVGVETPQQGSDDDMISRDVLGALYDDLLGRAPDQGAIDHYVGKYSTNFVVADLRASGEYAQRRASLQAQSANAANLQAELDNTRNELNAARVDRDAAKGQLQILIDGNVSDDATIATLKEEILEKDARIVHLEGEIENMTPDNPGTTAPDESDAGTNKPDTGSLYEKLVKLVTDIINKLKEKK